MDTTQTPPAGGAASPFRRPPRPSAARPSGPAPASGGPAFGPIPAEPLPAPAVRANPPASLVDETATALLERRRRSGALWFYWIAGLSLVNSLAALVDQSWRFVLGLGITQLADSLAAHSGQGYGVVAMVDAAVIGGVALLGRFAGRGKLWAFVAGGVFYALDGLLFIAEHDWLAIGFHVFVLVMIARGFDAARRLA